MQSLFNLLNEDISIWQNMKPTKFQLRTSAKKFFSNATSRRQTSTNAGICWDMHGREIYDDDHPCRKFEMRHVKIANRKRIAYGSINFDCWEVFIDCKSYGGCRWLQGSRDCLSRRQAVGRRLKGEFSWLSLSIATPLFHLTGALSTTLSPSSELSRARGWKLETVAVDCGNGADRPNIPAHRANF